jgi:hypothetical protein
MNVDPPSRHDQILPHAQPFRRVVSTAARSKQPIRHGSDCRGGRCAKVKRYAKYSGATSSSRAAAARADLPADPNSA